MTAEHDEQTVIGQERTCDGCAEEHPIAAVVGDAYVCASCVLVVVAGLHSKRTATNEYMAPHTYEYCVECRQVWPCATAKAMGEGADA